MTKFEKTALKCLYEAASELAVCEASLGKGNIFCESYAALAMMAKHMLRVSDRLERIGNKRREQEVECAKDSVKLIHEIIATEYDAEKNDDVREAMYLIESFAKDKYGMELNPPVETE